jgi:hypothetical protein
MKSSARPCHLYFDLEYNLKANRGADGEGMVDTLLSVIQGTLLDTFSLEYDASWTVELDSSTPGKPLFYLPFSFICAEFALLLEFHFTYCVLSVFYLTFCLMESSRLWWSSMLDIDNFFMV